MAPTVDGTLTRSALCELTEFNEDAFKTARRRGQLPIRVLLLQRSGEETEAGWTRFTLGDALAIEVMKDLRAIGGNPERYAHSIAHSGHIQQWFVTPDIKAREAREDLFWGLARVAAGGDWFKDEHLLGSPGAIAAQVAILSPAPSSLIIANVSAAARRLVGRAAALGFLTDGNLAFRRGVE